MIRLPKKIEETIKRELTQDYSVVERIFVETKFKASNVHLIVLRVGESHELIILRYFGDNSHSFLAGYADMREIKQELAYQISKLA